MGSDDPLLFAGNAHPQLAMKVCDYLGLGLGNAVVSRFPDGEIEVKLNEDVRGADVFVIQPTCPPVNETLMELLVMIDCFKRSSARRITAVLPYFGYARQDRKDQSRVPITAKLVANMIATAGVDRILTIDLHSAQIQGFFDIPVDHLHALPVLSKHVQEMAIADLVIVSPDVGSIRMARAYSDRLGARLATVDKRRISSEETSVEFVIGDVDGMNVLITDDLIATAGSIVKAAEILMKKGAREVFLCATHPVLCGPAMERLAEAPVTSVLVSDTIPIRGHLQKIKVLSIAPLIGEAINRIHLNQSVSSLFY